MNKSLSPPPLSGRVREVFIYDPSTGVFQRRVNSRRRPNMLVPAGGISAQGYVVIGLDGRVYMAHRVAWLYVHDEWPPEDIDHINGVRTDNRIANLRSVTRVVNSQNRRTPPVTKRDPLPLGVIRLARLTSKPFSARIVVDRRTISLGYFGTAEEASAAYLSAKRLHHPGCTI